MVFKEFISRVFFKLSCFSRRSEKQFYISVLVLVLICLAVIGVIFYRQKSQADDRDKILDEVKAIEEKYSSINSEDNDKDNNLVLKTETAKIKVYVCGEVKNPGVYEALIKARIEDLIEMAGGAGADACLEALNLAEEAFDGQKIYVPSIDEIKSSPFFQEGQSISGQIQDSGNLKILNINFAQKPDLELLPGIGPTLAQQIIDYRTQNGLFKKIEDIKKVKGIGDKKYELIKDKITI